MYWIWTYVTSCLAAWSHVPTKWVPSRALCPEWSLFMGVSVQEVFVQGVLYVQRCLCPGGSLSGGVLCPGGLLSRGFCQRDPPDRDPLYGEELAARVLLECFLVLYNFSYHIRTKKKWSVMSKFIWIHPMCGQNFDSMQVNTDRNVRFHCL